MPNGRKYRQTFNKNGIHEMVWDEKRWCVSFSNTPKIKQSKKKKRRKNNEDKKMTLDENTEPVIAVILMPKRLLLKTMLSTDLSSMIDVNKSRLFALIGSTENK